MNREDALLKAVAEGRLVHAVIVTGEGAESLCERAALVLLCEAGPEAKPCLACGGCRMAAADSHPDLLRLMPEPGKKTIGVEGVRSLLAALSSAPARGKNRAVLIFGAERLTEKAQNALLKTLEEPPENTVFLLAGNDNGLLPTVRSRCLTLRLSEAEIPQDAESDKKAQRLVSSVLAKNVLDRSLFPVERAELDDLLERLANECASRFQKTQKAELSKAVDVLLEARRRLLGNANAKMLIDWVRVKLERIFA